MGNDDPADQGAHEPRVTGAPEAIWLVYGEIEHDDTHANCCASGEVMWCEDAQFPADVRYTRTDLVAERARAAVAAERERWASLRAWVERSRKEHEAGQMMSIAESIHGAASMRDVLNQMSILDGPNVEFSGARAAG